MNVERINQWLNLAASIGVIVGLAFLVVEINQSNRIASYAAEHSRRNQWIEINSSTIANRELWAKLQAGDSPLDPAERAGALMMARQLINSWKDAEAAYDYGLLSEETFDTTLKDISAVLKEAPGLVVHFEYMVDTYEMDKEPSRVSQFLVDAVRRNGN